MRVGPIEGGFKKGEQILKKSKVAQRLLKPDPNFSPLPVEDNDELFQNGFFQFNITAMIKHIQENPSAAPIETISVKDFYSKFSTINESHVETVDVSKPVIIAEISPGKFNLIDGNHRMEKARRTGMESVQGHKLMSPHHLPFLTSKKAYLAYIEYWNDKIKTADGC